MPSVSPRSELKRFRQRSTMAGIIPFSCERLGYCLEQTKSDLLLLDCRTFFAHNHSHIESAVNVHCPAILRRRSGGRLPLRTVISDDVIREKLLAGSCHPVVLYDDHGLRPLHEDSMTIFVAKCLQLELGLKHIFILEGGFQEFRLLYPHLCSRQFNSSSTTAFSSSDGGSCCATPTGHEPQQESPVEILPHLFLGSAYHASCKGAMQRAGITALLNVSQSCPNHFEDCFRYMSIPVEDAGHVDISVWFAEAIQFIDEVKSKNGKVLVHCHAGISRSATICMAYLMVTKRLRMEEAYEYVKSRRRIISPNFNFMGQLLTFETEVFSPLRQTVSSPRSPMLATAAHSPDADALTPSRSAQQQNVFDFTNTHDQPNCIFASETSQRSPALISPMCQS